MKQRITTLRIVQFIGILLLIFACVMSLYIVDFGYKWLLLTHCLNLSLPHSIHDIEIAQIDGSTNCVTLVRFTIDPKDLPELLQSPMVNLPLSSTGDPFRLSEGIEFDIFWPHNWPRSLPKSILWGSSDIPYPITIMIDVTNDRAYIVYIQAYGKSIF